MMLLSHRFTVSPARLGGAGPSRAYSPVTDDATLKLSCEGGAGSGGMTFKGVRRSRGTDRSRRRTDVGLQADSRAPPFLQRRAVAVPAVGDFGTEHFCPIRSHVSKSWPQWLHAHVPATGPVVDGGENDNQAAWSTTATRQRVADVGRLRVHARSR